MADFKSEMILEDLYDGVQRYHCLKLIYELGVHDILNDNKSYLSAEQICIEIKTCDKTRDIIPSSLQRVLRYLACFDIIDEKYLNDTDNLIVFKTTDVLKHLKNMPTLQQDKFCPRIIDIVNRSSERYNCPSEIVLNGRSLYQYMDDTPSYKKFFVNYMQTLTNEFSMDIPRIADVIKNENQSHGKIVDLGGSSGQMMESLHKNIPTLKCINFDRDEVIKGNKPLANVEMLAGDMFNVTNIPSADIFFTKNVLHTLSDQQCIKLMQNTHVKLNKDGILMSVNYIQPEPGQQKDAWWCRAMDVSLLLMIGKGKTRTLSEFRQLHKTAGFYITKTVLIGHKQKPTMVLVARKIEKS